MTAMNISCDLLHFASSSSSSSPSSSSLPVGIASQFHVRHGETVPVEDLGERHDDDIGDDEDNMRGQHRSTSAGDSFWDDMLDLQIQETEARDDTDHLFCGYRGVYSEEDNVIIRRTLEQRAAAQRAAASAAASASRGNQALAFSPVHRKKLLSSLDVASAAASKNSPTKFFFFSAQQRPCHSPIRLRDPSRGGSDAFPAASRPFAKHGPEDGHGIYPQMSPIRCNNSKRRKLFSSADSRADFPVNIGS